MANLRLLKVKVFDSTTIKAQFNNILDDLINTANVEVNANTPGIPDPQVIMVEVQNDILVITTQPMTPYGAYFITFQSTDLFKFKSKDGTAFLFEDGQTNVSLILGAEDPDDKVRDILIHYLEDGVYNLDFGTLIRDIINSQASNISKALHDIGQAKNDNYLSITILDEQKIRGVGPFDRLVEEGVYEIIRVSKQRSGISDSTFLSFDSFPTFPITLLTVAIINEKLIIGNGPSTFNGLLLNLSKNFITKLTNLVIAYQNGSSATYNIPVFGYQLLDATFDQDFASTFLTLANNQIKLNDQILNSSFVLPKAGDVIFVSYEYQEKGRVVEENSVIVSQVLQSLREVTPPILTNFTLAHSPIVSQDDLPLTSGGVVFLDPAANPPFSSTHPAFLNEILFKFDTLPNRPGQYSIDYSTGRVFCYGASANDGTGDFPPTATYFYRSLFSPRLDYTYDPDSFEMVASPIRDLAGQSVKVSFSYELVLVPDVDYKAQIHQEILDERIQNRLKTTNSFSVLNTPITNVFRIFNETTGEVYNIQRWNDSTVFFNFNTSPAILEQDFERASFTDVLNFTLIENSEFVNSLNNRVIEFILLDNRIIGASEDVIGSSFNSSASFSRVDIFNKELYYDNNNNNSISFNTNRLKIGEYQVDYQNGIIYCAVLNSQNFDFGTINYKKSTISTKNIHIISVLNIYQTLSVSSIINKKINYISFDDTTIQPASFDVANERFLNGNLTNPYVVNAGTITVTNNVI